MGAARNIRKKQEEKKKQEDKKVHVPDEQFKQKAGHKDPNLVELMASYIEMGVGESEAAMFKSTPSIVGVMDNLPTVQRITINRFFTNILMRFRSKKEVDVNNIIPYLIQDGDIKDWFTLINEFVLPFFKEHNVINVVND